MEENLKEEILAFIQQKEMEKLKFLLSSSDNMEIIYSMTEMSPNEEVIVFRLLTKADALEVFEYLDTSLQQKLLKSFTDEKTVEIMKELPPDDRVRLMEELPATVAKKLINSLSKEEREATSILMGYEPKTAGRIMTTEYISLRRDQTAGDALQKVRQLAKEKETIYTLYVTDNAKKLEGVLTLKGLLVAELDNKIEEIMTHTVIKAYTDTDQEEVANTLHDLDLLAIPVVDREDRLVGIVTYDDAMDILEEEATEDILDHAGLADVASSEANRSELLVSGSLWKIWRVRLPILLITLGFGMFSGVIIDEFEDTLESIAMVAIFIPLIMAMGGSVGTQSSTVFARGVVLGHIQTKKFFRHFLKEIWVGFSIGVVIGVITGVIAALWHMPMLGLAVGLSLIATMTIAALLGFLVPFVLIKFNVDQAAGSAPIITSIKDIVGLVIYFVLVNMFLGNIL